ncbi:MAG: XrtA system polysaccharide chain length determinant [Pseudoxanthomonas sp.]
MSGWQGAGSGGDSRSPLALLPVALKELRRRPVLLAAIFAVIALLGLAVGLMLPKKYVASTSILVEEGNIISPLMEGRAVATSNTDRASILREVAFSRKVMDDILTTGGWMAAKPSAVEQDRMIEKIVGRTSISNPRANLVSIVYNDSDAERAYRVTKRFGEQLISESLAAKARESRQAYDFINSQVEEYHQKLQSSESQLEQFRTANPDARPGVEGDTASRISQLRSIIDAGRMELIELRSQDAALRSQLSGEHDVTLSNTRGTQYRQRLIELQAQRDQLMMNYTEQHPDVVRIQHQINDVQEDLRREQSRPHMAGESDAQFNPLYGELRSKQAEASRRAAATASRVGMAEGMLAKEEARSTRITSSESKTAELNRDYQVDRDIYQDLLKRRENARVSMNLDAEGKSMSFRIQEPASVPLRPSGLRVSHVAMIGLVLAIVLPLLVLFALVRLDPRVRTALQVEREAGLPVLGTMPAYLTAPQRAAAKRHMLIACVVLASVPVLYVVVFALKLLEVL